MTPDIELCHRKYWINQIVENAARLSLSELGRLYYFSFLMAHPEEAKARREARQAARK